MPCANSWVFSMRLRSISERSDASHVPPSVRSKRTAATTMTTRKAAINFRKMPFLTSAPRSGSPRHVLFSNSAGSPGLARSFRGCGERRRRRSAELHRKYRARQNRGDDREKRLVQDGGRNNRADEIRLPWSERLGRGR